MNAFANTEPTEPAEELMENAADELRIRFYEPRDRDAVRHICASTGFLGKPIDPLFEDRELFADFLTSYYTDAEPESTLVCEAEGIVQGYLTGCRRIRRYKRWQLWANARLVLKGAWRYFTKPYGEATRKYLHWVLTRGRKETPLSLKDTPHFHINLLPRARNIPNTRALMHQFFSYLIEKGEKAVYGQIITFEDRRGEKFFARYGFQVLDRREVTKYRHLTEERVFLFTVYRTFEHYRDLYGGGPSRPK